MKRSFALLASVLIFSACVDSRNPSVPTSETGEPVCEDRDGDGYGEGCALGGDCNDRDRSVHVGCARCATPEQGCDCEEGTSPISCYREPSALADGTIMCHEGTRYCREGQWSACESIVSYPRPDDLETQAIVDPNGATQHCNDCTVNCFVIHDNLDPVDAGLDATSSNITSPSGGGLTLTSYIPDASMDAGAPFDPSLCVPGTAPDQDCDGIPDEYDPYPLEKPFATANPTIFLDVGPGETGTGVVELEFYLNSADVYFLVDQTGSMAGERDQLKNDLVTGNFINDPSYDCADYDFDRQPNNELKAQGIVGAVRCMIRDANFGVGYFREIPLWYGRDDNVTYRNLQDITADIPSVISAVSKLETISNNDWPEASMLALYALATSQGYYFGVNHPGLAPRTDCPSLAFGYPCFRESAIPIVLMFTDAQFHQGPTVKSFPYDPARLTYTSGTQTTVTGVPASNETYASAYDLGNLTSAYVSVSGNTQSMSSNFDISKVTCGSNEDAAPDAMFKFTLTSSQSITASTIGSDFDTTLSIFRGPPPTPIQTQVPASNDTTASPYDFSSANGKYQIAHGDSTGFAHDYSANDVSCGAAAMGTDATFKFKLDSPTRVALSTSGSSYASSMALFSPPPLTTSYTNIGSYINNNGATAYNVGSTNSRNRGYAGDTSASGFTASYTGAQLGCSPADAAKDAVYDFTLTSATRVRLSTEDSPLDAVIALTTASGGVTLIPTSIANNNETQASAYNVGTLDNAAFQLLGNTEPMNSDYSSSLTGCNSSGWSRDAVFKFSLASTRTVHIDTADSQFDTSLSLFRGQVGTGASSVSIGSNNNEAQASAFDLGTLNGKSLITSGASTGSMRTDYDDVEIGCGSSSSSADAVYRFHLSADTRVQLDTDGSSFDTVASLHSSLGNHSVTTLATPPEAPASARLVTNLDASPYQSFEGSTSGMNADVPVDDNAGCSANSSAKDAVFKLNITTDGSYEINTEGSSFDTVLGLFPDPINVVSSPAPTAIGSAGDVTPYNIGTLDNRWVSFSGSTSGMSANSSATNCSASASSPDVFFTFTLASARTVSIDTSGSSFDTVLIMSNGSCNDDASWRTTTSRIVTDLAAGTYQVMIKGYSSSSKGSYQITFQDTAVTDSSNLLLCDNDSGGGAMSKLTTNLDVGTYYVVVKGRRSSDSGNYRLTVKNLDRLSGAGRIACDNDSSAGSASLIEADLSAGDYYVVVKGTSSGARGNYSLKLTDLNATPGRIACNDDFVGKTSQLEQTLSPGDYYVVVKGTSGWNRGPYTLTLRDAGVAIAGSYVCDYGSGPSGTSIIERDLNAGSYRVVVKGKKATDAGPYKLIIRDIGQVPSGRVACDQNSGAGGSAYIERDLAAGEYTVVLQSATASGAGDYQLSVRDASLISSGAATLCDNDSDVGSASKLRATLAAGEYYALVKGDRTADKGLYQLNIGVDSATSAGLFVPPTWAQTRDALVARGIRVIPVLSCHDDPNYGDANGACNEARAQAEALANVTGAVGSTLDPLVFDIDGDGTGLSKTVVDGIGQLAEYLEMNVSVRVVFEPDPNPGFELTVRAVDEPGDGCSGLLGVEHQRCAPGATPRFELAFVNPVDRPVPSNPADPNGGYSFRAELIGDSQFIVDRVPIYILPHDLTPPEPDPVYEPSGSYWQDVHSNGCVGTQRPDWHDLTWNADIPEGTSVSFSVCASDDQTTLDTCTLAPLCTVTGGAACTSDSDCPNGYCSTASNCQTVTGGPCGTDEDCSRGSTCRSGVCNFGGQPVYIGGVLDTSNYTSTLRMQVGLSANTSANTAPTVYDWSLNYVCNSAQ